MTCQEARITAIEHIRSGVPVSDPHFQTCLECSRFLQGQLALQTALARVAQAVPRPPKMEARLLAELDSCLRSPRQNIGWLLPAAVALAASLIAVTVIGVHHPAPKVLYRKALQQQAVEEPFLQIPYTAPLSPYERTSVIRMSVPVAALIAAGYDVHSVDTGAELRADVLIGQDGRALAIRPITNSVVNSN